MVADRASEGVLGAGSAPAKAILLGEHAVVYGRPALAVPLHAIGARAVVREWDAPLTVRASFPPGDARAPRTVDVASAANDEPLAVAVRLVLEAAGVPRPRWPRWIVELESTVPVGSGLGSSAAVAVAILRAVASAARLPADMATIAPLAHAVERCTHGTPSGIDHTVVTLGRPIRFASGVAIALAVGAPVELLIADSGTIGRTRDMVTALRARREVDPERHERWFDEIARDVGEALVALRDGDLRGLGHAMDANHAVLQAVGVSTPVLDGLVTAARSAGALGAKLSGAGGGGVTLALVEPEVRDAVAASLRAAGARRLIHATLEACAA